MRHTTIAKRPEWLVCLRRLVQLYASCVILYAALYPFASVPVGTEISNGTSVGAVDIICDALFHVVVAPLYAWFMCRHAWGTFGNVSIRTFHLLLDWLRVLGAYSRRVWISVMDAMHQMVVRIEMWMQWFWTNVLHALWRLFRTMCIWIGRHIGAWTRWSWKHVWEPLLGVCCRFLAAVIDWINVPFREVIERMWLHAVELIHSMTLLLVRAVYAIWLYALHPFIHHACIPIYRACRHCLVALGQWIEVAYRFAYENVCWFLSLCWRCMYVSANLAWQVWAPIRDVSAVLLHRLYDAAFPVWTHFKATLNAWMRRVISACRAYVEHVQDRVRVIGTEMAMHVALTYQQMVKHTDAVMAAAWHIV